MPRLNAEDYIYATFAFASADEQLQNIQALSKRTTALMWYQGSQAQNDDFKHCLCNKSIITKHDRQQLTGKNH